MNIDDFKLSDLTYTVYSVKSKSGDLLSPTVECNWRGQRTVAMSIYDTLFGSSFRGEGQSSLINIIEALIFEPDSANTIKTQRARLEKACSPSIASDCLGRIELHLKNELIHLTKETVSFGSNNFNVAALNYLKKDPDPDRDWANEFFRILNLIAHEKEPVTKLGTTNAFVTPSPIGSLTSWEEKNGFIDEGMYTSDFIRNVMNGSLAAIPNISWSQYVDADYDKAIHYLTHSFNESQAIKRAIEEDNRSLMANGLSDAEYQATCNDQLVCLEEKIKKALIDNQTLENDYNKTMSLARNYFEVMLPRSSRPISQQQTFAMMAAPNGRCPKCTHPLYTRKVGLSSGKAAFGGLLAGFTGALVGATMGKKEYYCPNCGYVR